MLGFVQEIKLNETNNEIREIIIILIPYFHINRINQNLFYTAIYYLKK